MSKLANHIMSYLIVLSLIIIIVASISSPVQNSPVLTIGPNVPKFQQYVLQHINEVASHIKYFTSLGTRVPGYSSYYKAVKYIESQFKSFGLKVYIEEFNVTVPIDYGSKIEILHNGRVIKSFKAYALLPNLVETCQTPPEGIIGKLVYVGDGSKINGLDLNNSIVLMDFVSGSRWLELTSLGVKGIIFSYNPSSIFATASEAMSKFSMIPINIPRVLIFQNQTTEILKLLSQYKELEVRLIVNMVYKQVPAYNIIAVKYASNSSTYKDEAIYVVAYFDSWSITPGYAPGADEAAGIATLLAIAKYISQINVDRNIVFIAFSGHHQGLAGAREFVYWHIRPRGKAKYPSWLYLEGSHVVMILQVDPSIYFSPTGETELMIYDAGAFYGATAQDHRLKEQTLICPKGEFGEYVPSNLGYYGIDDVIAYLYRKYNISIGNMVQEGRLSNTPFYNPDDHPLSRRRYFEIEPFIRVGQYAFTITSGALSPKRMTPGDDWNSIKNKIKNVWPYFLLSLIWTYRLATYRGTLPHYAPRTINDNNYPTLIVHVEEYNESLQKYLTVPYALVVIHFNPMDPNVNHFIIVEANASGYAIMRGAASSGIQGAYEVYAFKDDPSVGPVDYAPDFSPRYGLMSFGVTITATPFVVRTAVFKAASMVLYDVINPEDMTPVIPSVLVINHHTKDTAHHYSYFTDCEWHTFSRETIRPILIVFMPYTKKVEPAPPWDVLIYPALSRNHLIILTNNGKGFWIKKGEQYIVLYPPLYYAKEILKICSNKIEFAISHRIYIGNIEHCHKLAQENLEKAYEALKERDYAKAMALGIVAWSYARIAYLDLRGTLMDTSAAAIFFLLLAIPFAYLLESLLFEHKSLRKKALTVALILIASGIIMYFVHPALMIAHSAPLVALSFLLMILSVVPITMIISKVVEVTKRLRKEMLGLHFSEISRTGAVVLAASMATRNLRRRKVRAILTIISATIMVAAFVSTVSVVSTRAVAVLKSYNLPHAPYNGILVSMSSLNALPEEVVEGLKDEFGDNLKAIAPRAYYTPSFVAFVSGMPIARSGYMKLVNLEKGKMVYIEGLLGLSVDEVKVTKINRLIVEGRFFSGNDAMECLLPITFKKMLDVTIGDYVSFRGQNFKVVGFYDPQLFRSLIDLDGETLAPIALASTGGRVTAPEVIRLDPEDFIIVPYRVVLRNQGIIYNVAMVLKDPHMIYKVAYDIVSRTRLKVHVCVNDTVKILTRVSRGQIIGSEIAIPAAIIIFIIMNTSFGAVYERRREVEILSAIGLSPQHIAGLFLAEFFIIGVISGFIGYLLGVGLPYLVPGLKANTTTSGVAMAVGISILVILLATAYPVWLASRSVTPSFERKWKLEKVGIRRGDEYIIKIPVVVSPLELDGLIYYLLEYLDLFKVETEAKSFLVEDIKVESKTTPDGEVKTIKTRVRVRPFDYGVSMLGNINFVVPFGSQNVRTELHIKRLGGVEYVWLKGVRNFTDEIRKQLLLWRALSLNERRKYIRKAKEALKF